MIQMTPQMRIPVAVEAVDFRKGIDGLGRGCAGNGRTLPIRNPSAMRVNVRSMVSMPSSQK